MGFVKRGEVMAEKKTVKLRHRFHKKYTGIIHLYHGSVKVRDGIAEVSDKYSIRALKTRGWVEVIEEKKEAIKENNPRPKNEEPKEEESKGDPDKTEEGKDQGDNK